MKDGFNRIIVEEQDKAVIIRFKESDILDQINIQEIGDEMNRVVESSPDINLIVDFKGVQYLSSTALGKLITLKRKVDKQNGRLCFCNIKEAILEVFRITKLDTIFDIVPSLDAALKKF